MHKIKIKYKHKLDGSHPDVFSLELLIIKVSVETINLLQFNDVLHIAATPSWTYLTQAIYHV